MRTYRVPWRVAGTLAAHPALPFVVAVHAALRHLGLAASRVWFLQSGTLDEKGKLQQRHIELEHVCN